MTWDPLFHEDWDDQPRGCARHLVAAVALLATTVLCAVLDIEVAISTVMVTAIVVFPLWALCRAWRHGDFHRHEFDLIDERRAVRAALGGDR